METKKKGEKGWVLGCRQKRHRPGAGVWALPVVGYRVSVQHDAGCLQGEGRWERGGQGGGSGDPVPGGTGGSQGGLAMVAPAPAALTSLPAVSWPRLAREKTETGGGAAGLSHGGGRSHAVTPGGTQRCLKPDSPPTTTSPRQVPATSDVPRAGRDGEGMRLPALSPKMPIAVGTAGTRLGTATLLRAPVPHAPCQAATATAASSTRLAMLTATGRSQD